MTMRSATIPTKGFLSGRPRGRWERSSRQVDHERGLGHAVAGEAQESVVSFDDLAGDGEPESGPLGFGREERLKDSFLQIRGNTLTGIADGHPDPLGAGRLHLDVHHPIGGRGLYTVLD